MRNYHNIENQKKPKNATRGAGCYVGYAPLSGIWHISGRSGAWYARCTTDRSAGIGAFWAKNMAEVSRELESR